MIQRFTRYIPIIKITILFTCCVILFSCNNIEPIDISVMRSNVPFLEQVKSIRVADLHDFSTMGNSYSDKIYEKYDAITFGRQSIDVIGLFNEPIEWIVLEKKEDSALLLSKYIIDCKAFDNVDIESIGSADDELKEKYKNCDWSKSTLRSWLNNEFFNYAFSDREQEKIILTHMEDTDSDDKLFCLSKAEYIKYFDNNRFYERTKNLGDLHLYYNGATARNRKAQAYDKLHLFQPDETYGYWLRDKTLNSKEQGIDFGSTLIVGHMGEIGYSINLNTFVGVRPAMWVSLK